MLDVFGLISNMLDVFSQIETLDLKRPHSADPGLVILYREQTWKKLQACGAELRKLHLLLGQLHLAQIL